MAYIGTIGEVGAICLGVTVVTIVIHELGHVLAVLALRWKVTGIGLVTWRSVGVGMDPSPAAQQSLVVFGRGLRIVALCGPLANVVAGLVCGTMAWALRADGFHQVTTAMLLLSLAIGQIGGALQLVPSRNKLLGNDGNVVFQEYKNESFLQGLLSEQ